MRSSSRLSIAIVPLCALIAMALPGTARALKAPGPLSDLEEADRKALETIAAQPEHLRDAALKASLHVDALVETQRIQEQSSASFQERIGKLDKNQQEQIWNIVREPGLLDELATEEKPSSSQLDEIAKRHPESLASAIRANGAKQHDLFVDVAQIHRRAAERFDAAISDLDADTQQAFRDLVDKPDLLSVLVKRVNLVVKLGDSYRKNPKDTRSYLTAFAKDVEKRDAAAAKEWKEKIESDPKASAELDQAAREYSDENGYDYEELTSPQARTRVTVVVNPYPYWFGYPYWYADYYVYPYGYWYPYPAYFGYYPYYGHYVWWGFPAFPFVHWFYYDHHHNHYPYLANCFGNYYHGRPYVPTYNNVTVNNFVGRSDTVANHRGNWSWGGGGGRSGGPGGTAGAPVSYSGRDRGFFFNRGGRGLSQLDRRTAPGESGFAIDQPRNNSGSGGFGRSGRSGRGQIHEQPPQRDTGTMPSDANVRSMRPEGGGRSRGHAGNAPSAHSSAPVFESPQQDRGHAQERGRGGFVRPSVSAERFQHNDQPQVQAPAPAAEPRGGGRGGNWSHRGAPQARSEGVAPQVQSPAPSARDDGGGQGGGYRGSGGNAYRGDGGGGHGWSGGASRGGGGGGGGRGGGGGWGHGGGMGGGGDFGGGGGMGGGGGRGR